MSEKPVGSYGLDAHGNAILEEFREKRPIFARMLSIVRDTLRKSIMDNHIYINAVEARIKEEGSLAGKLDRKGEKYRSLDDITDILGVRGEGSDYVDSQVWPMSQCDAFLTMVFALGRSNSSMI